MNDADESLPVIDTRDTVQKRRNGLKSPKLPEKNLTCRPFMSTADQLDRILQ